MKRILWIVVLAIAQIGVTATAAPAQKEKEAPTAVATAETPAPTPAPTVAEKPAVRSKVPIEIYGSIRLDAAYDQALMDNGNYARWVVNAPGRAKDNQLNVTARQTRLGLNFLPTEKLKVNGKLEIDFYGAGTENKNIPMMRLAYLEWTSPGMDLSVLAGQAADVIAPLNAPMVDYTVGWWAGNIGYRRPQFRLSLGTGQKSDYRTLIQVAAARTVGDTDGSGEATGMPTGEARLAQCFRIGKAKTSTLGVWCHGGMEDYEYVADQATGTYAVRSYRTTSVGGDLELNLCKQAVLRGEGWWGQNLDAFLGGIGQGVNQTLHRNVKSRGGWVALSLGPVHRVTLNGGCGVDRPIQGDLNNGDREQNLMVFVNAMVQVDSACQVGLEASNWKTEYMGSVGRLEGNRGQVSCAYSF